MITATVSSVPGILVPLDLGDPTGLRVAVKDCLDIAGLPTRCGTAARADAAPAQAHATVVARLLDHGFRIVGKTRMHELAFGMTGVNAHDGTPVNPRWPDRIPGGSSSGSAVAVAAGLADIAIGTDTGGSVRQPAICCGVIGLKPGFGRIPRQGAYPADSSLDCIGPMARNMDGIERAMQALDPDFVPERLPDAPRLVRLRTDLERDLGHDLILPLMEQGYPLPRIDLPLMDDAFRAAMTIIAHETRLAFGDLLDTGLLGADVRDRLIAASRVTPQDLARAEAVRRDFTAQVDAVLDDCDALVTPALPEVPPQLSQAGDPARILPLTRYLRPFNLSGHPAIVLPMLTTTGLPAGLQIVARKGQEARLCAIARWLTDTVPRLSTKD